MCVYSLCGYLTRVKNKFSRIKHNKRGRRDVRGYILLHLHWVKTRVYVPKRERETIIIHKWQWVRVLEKLGVWNNPRKTQSFSLSHSLSSYKVKIFTDNGAVALECVCVCELGVCKHTHTHTQRCKCLTWEQFQKFTNTQWKFCRAGVTTKSIIFFLLYKSFCARIHRLWFYAAVYALYQK